MASAALLIRHTPERLIRSFIEHARRHGAAALISSASKQLKTGNRLPVAKVALVRPTDVSGRRNVNGRTGLVILATLFRILLLRKLLLPELLRAGERDGLASIVVGL